MLVVSTVAGRFRLERRLGSGGFATVWLARDPELDAPVAVKILADNWAGHPDVRRRFTDEGRLLRRVDNDLVVRVYDVGMLDDGRPYLVMTYADGGSLADRLTSHPPPWSGTGVLALVDALAAALGSLHEHGIVHRDVNPRNVLFRRAGAAERVLLGDLGIAKDLRWASGLTWPAGTTGYRAPEQAVVSADIGPATDVHALAVTAGELLGVPGPPWPAGPLGAALTRGTVTDPARRTPTPARFAAELRAALGGRADPAPVRRRRWRVPAAPGARAVAALAVVAVLATLAWFGIDRETRYVSSGGAVALSVPGDWTASPALVPGEPAGEGLRLVDGARSVTAAVADVTAAPAAVVTRRPATGCASVQSYEVTAGALRGPAFRYRDCADRVEVTQVGLADPDRPGRVVWLEVRAEAGTPHLADLLDTLVVDP